MAATTLHFTPHSLATPIDPQNSTRTGHTLDPHWPYPRPSLTTTRGPQWHAHWPHPSPTHWLHPSTLTHWPHPSILTTPHSLATPINPHNSTLPGHTHTHPPALTTPHHLNSAKQYLWDHCVPHLDNLGMGILATPHSVATPTPIHPHSQLHTNWPHPGTLTHWPHP